MGSFSSDECDSDTKPQRATGFIKGSLTTSLEIHQHELSSKHIQDTSIDSVSSRLEATSLGRKPSCTTCNCPSTCQNRCIYCEAEVQNRPKSRLISDFIHLPVGLECVKRVEVSRCSVCAVYLEQSGVQIHLSSEEHLRKMANSQK